MIDKLLNIINENENTQKDIFFRNEKNPFSCTNDLLELLVSAVEKKEPFSMIRLGDGEGRILGFPDVFEEQVYINQVLTYQFGKSVIKALKEEFGSDYLAPSMLKLKSMIEGAIDNADIIGAPSWLHFRAGITEENQIPLAAQSICLEYANKSTERGCKIFDHFIFKPFHKEGFFAELLSHVNVLNVISHSDISENIKSKFQLKECRHIKIPGHQSFMKSGELHYPVEYKKIIKEFDSVNLGELYFVAAGYLGKHYCNEIKQNGGIAIDIGSIFDGWCGRGRSDSIQNEEQRI